MKAEAKQQEDKVKAEPSETAAAATEGGGKSVTIQADAKSGDTPDAKKAKTGSADKAEAEMEADVPTAAVPEAAEVSGYYLCGSAGSCCVVVIEKCTYCIAGKSMGIYCISGL